MGFPQSKTIAGKWVPSMMISYDTTPGDCGYYVVSLKSFCEHNPVPVKSHEMVENTMGGMRKLQRMNAG